MIIEHLYMKDFMSIQEAEFKFSPEEEVMVLLKGGNGSGKSSIFHAIAFAMLGLRKGSSAKNFIRRGTDKFYITLKIRKRPTSDPYYINIIGGKKTMPPVNKTITYQGNDYKNSEYDIFIKKEFDIPLLDAIVFTMQGNNDITVFKPSQLREMLKQVFQISFETEHDDIVNTAHQLAERVQATNNSISSYKQSLSILNEGQESSILKRPPSKAVLDSKHLEISKLQNRIAEIQKDTEALKKIEDSLLSKKKELERVQESIKQVQAEKNNSEFELKEKEKKRDLLLVTSQTLKGLIDKEPKVVLEESLVSYDSSKMTIQVSLNEVLRKIDVSKNDTCFTCGQKLPEDWINNKNEFPIELKTLKQELKNTLAAIENTRETLQRIKDMEQKAVHVAYEITSINDQIDSLKTNINNKLTSDYYINLTSTQVAVQMEYIALQEEWEKNISLRKELDEESKLQEEVDIKIKDLKSLEDNLIAYEAQKKIKRDIADKKVIIEKELVELSNQEISLGKDLETYKAAQRLVEKYLPTYGILVAGEKVISSMSKIIQPIFPDWEMRLVPCRDGVDFEYRSEGEEEYSSISMASGFESALCSIAFKLALTAYYQFPTLILDEIDEAAEDKNSYLLFDSMTSFKKEHNIQQIWIVSHKETVVSKLLSEYGHICKVFKADKGAFTVDYSEE